MEEYHRITGNRSITTFRQVLSELGNLWKSSAELAQCSVEHEMLQARCNIFEALLIKYFRSSADFEKIIMK